ncbi:MAG: aldehyde ferredoxin oxidoreductase family protein [Spirochaetales bacterium]|nr:aldehyde ferredoxin oxidoreductase family protein [Spirochaetales bacterium]
MAKTAWINLSNREVSIRETPKDLLQKYIGSRGIAAKMLYDLVDKKVAPLSPENVLIFSTGPLTGTPWPSAARYTVTAKSPATGAYGYANSSGFFGPQMKKAGYDMFIIQGKSPVPVYLHVEDNDIKILSAEDLWGKETGETEDILKARHEGVKVAEIGPAGENLIQMASVINDHGRAAARTGMGAVMGSKNLKAIAVRGTKPLEIPPKFRDVIKRVAPLVNKNPAALDYNQWGTVILLNYKNRSGDNPSKNHLYGQFPMGDNLNAQAIAKYTIKNKGCFACGIKCARMTEVPDGPYKTPLQEGPEYETANSLGPNVWNDNPEVLIYCNKLCNEMGIDTISVGVLIAFAMEAHEKGLLYDEKYNLNWGDPGTIIGLIEDISRRTGTTGALLAQGVKKAAEILGGESKQFAMEVKNVEIPRQEGRVLKAMALAHATSNRGADHLYALPTIDLTGNLDIVSKVPSLKACGPELMETSSEKFKAEMVRYTEACNALADALGICKFTFTETYAILPADLAEGLRALGIDISDEELFHAGERIVTIERMYNVKHGFSRKDDTLPGRNLHEPLNVYVEPKEIGTIHEETAELVKEGLLVNLEPMLDDYYRLGGWDRNGIPLEKRLKELKMEECITDLPL